MRSISIFTVIAFFGYFGPFTQVTKIQSESICGGSFVACNVGVKTVVPHACTHSNEEYQDDCDHDFEDWAPATECDWVQTAEFLFESDCADFEAPDQSPCENATIPAFSDSTVIEGTCVPAVVICG